MKTLRNRADQAIDTAAAVQSALRPGESAATFLERTARRRLVCGADGKKQLAFEEPAFSGFVRLSRDGRELYLNAGQLTGATAPRLLATGRPLFRLGSPGADEAGPRPYRFARPAGDGTPAERVRLDMSETAGRAGALMAAVGAGLRPGQIVAGVHVSDILRESVFQDSSGVRLRDECYGVELTAVVSDDTGSRVVTATRYADTVDDIDPAGLGRELSLIHTGVGPAGSAGGESRVVFAPSAVAQLLRALVNTVLLNPVAHPAPLVTSLVDEGPCPHAYGTRTFDCEGTATGTLELVGRDGRQRPLATRKVLPADAADRAGAALTGHAWWNPLKNFPQLTAGNVRLAPTAGTSAEALLEGERLVVVDARTLGVEEFRSGGQLAFRLLAVRAVDGVPQEACAPVSVEGAAIDFLASVTEVADGVSYFPGQTTAGGTYLEMDLNRITSKTMGT